MKYKFEALPCISNNAGNTIRPYAIDDEVIFEMNLSVLLEDEACGKNDQVNNLAKAVSEKIGSDIDPHNLVGYLTEKCIEVNE